MIDSRKITDLRPDVAKACNEVIARAKAQGINIIITSTVRDDECQAKLYKQGRTTAGSIVTNAKLPTFHWIKTGLAFDFCPVDSKGNCLWGRTDLFSQVGKIGESIGLEWGGDWRSFVDRPHLQWSDGGKYTDTMVRALHLPPIWSLKSTRYCLNITDISTRAECVNVSSVGATKGYTNNKIITSGSRYTVAFTDISTQAECTALAELIGATGYTNHSIMEE